MWQNSEKYQWSVFTLKPWAMQTGSQYFNTRCLMYEPPNRSRSGRMLLIPLYYSITEFLMIPYIFAKELAGEIKIIAPKRLLDTPLGNYIAQRGLDIYSILDEPQKWLEDQQKKDIYFLWFPYGLFMDKEQSLMYHLGIKSIRGLIDEIQKEYHLLWSTYPKEETSGKTIHQNLEETSIYIFNAHFCPSVFNSNPLDSICDISYEELAYGALKTIDTENTLLDDKHLLEIIFVKYPLNFLLNASDESVKQLFGKFQGLTSPDFETLLFTLIQTLLPLKYTWKSFRNRFLLLLEHTINSTSSSIAEDLKTVYNKILTGELFSPWDKTIDFLQKCGYCERQTKGLRVFASSTTAYRNDSYRLLRKLRIVNSESVLPQDKKVINKIKWVPDLFLSKRCALNLYYSDVNIFEDDYMKAFHPEWSKDAEVGKPFFKHVSGARVGVVFCHGYLSAPMEVRALAEYIYRCGYSVYGVRLKGHGTSPLDLANTSWTEWYDALNRGIACMLACCEKVFLCGFSAGGCLVLSATANKQNHIAGVISISAPLKLQNYAIHLVPTISTLNVVLKKFGGGGWELFDHHPENPHINYQKNPLGGLRQLRLLMEQTEELLPQITVPALIIQGSNDQTVNPDSAQIIFQNIRSEQKQLLMFNRARHGILNSSGKEQIFSAVEGFISEIAKSNP